MYCKIGSLMYAKQNERFQSMVVSDNYAEILKGSICRGSLKS